MSIFKKDYSKTINEKEIELRNLENQIIENKEYFNNINKEINSLLLKKKEIEIEINAYNLKLKEIKQEYNAIYEEVNKFNINYVDSLEGLEFEQYIADLLVTIGFENVEKTKASNDYGVDIIAEKENVKYAIQCKNYTNPLGNSCVQEVYSGKQYYNCHVAVVVTNSTFTKNASDLAEKDGVLLWDRNYLIKLLEKYANASKKIIKIENKIENINLSTNDFEEPLYDEIVEFVVATGKASASLLQRKFRLGYNRAVRCMDLLEKNGVIGPNKGSIPRDVLITFVEK